MSKRLLLAGTGFALLFAVGASAIGSDPPPVMVEQESIESIDFGFDGGYVEVGRAEFIVCLKACKSACDRFAPVPAKGACYAACLPFCWQFL